MISDNIKKFRTENNLTQKELADKLFVTPQAVSRWEKGDVEPSVDTIQNLAKIFNCTTDEILIGPKAKPEVSKESDPVKEVKPNQETKLNKEVEQVETPSNPEVVAEVKSEPIVNKPVLAVCEICNKPIYNSEDIVRNNSAKSAIKVLCSDCERERLEQQQINKINENTNARKKSFIFGPIISVAVLIFGLIIAISNGGSFSSIITAILVAGMSFTFASCLFFDNNFVEDLFIDIATWGFVKFPGVIFSFDLDGLLWLIGIKILFWILSMILGCFVFILALVICLPISAIVYPFALKKNINNLD